MKQESQKTERNYGIDLLRMVSMVMVVLLHILGGGQLLETAEPHSARYALLWLLEIAAYCGVNCYGLISGYVGYGHKWNPANLIKLWLQVFFYTSSLCLLFKFITPRAIGLRTVIKAFIPLYSSAYWYFSAYFCMFFFLPFFNAAMERFSKRTATALVAALVVFLSVYPVVYPDIWIVSGGYSAVWLSALYLIGAYVKKYEVLRCIKKWVFLPVYSLGVLFVWGIRFASALFLPAFSEKANRLLSYTSPAILLCAVALLGLFSVLPVKGNWQKAVRFFAPASFGVYLIHWNKCLRGYYPAVFSRFAEYPAVLTVLLVIASALAIWLAASCIDVLRIKLFALLRLDRFAAFLPRKLTAFFQKIKQYHS